MNLDITLFNQLLNDWTTLEQKMEQDLSHLPNGKLRVSQPSRGAPQYYFRKDAKDKNGHYLRHQSDADMDLVPKLAQREYAERMLPSVHKISRALQVLIREYQRCSGCYACLPESKKVLVRSYISSDEEYLGRWQAEEYSTNSYPFSGAEYITQKGERVRSKSEMIIADRLAAKGIPYRYECALRLSDGKYIYPDFTILDVKARRVLYLEHFGRLDDPEYLEKALEKLKKYEQSGIYPGEQLIVTVETKTSPLNIRQAEKMWLHYLSM